MTLVRRDVSADADASPVIDFWSQLDVREGAQRCRTQPQLALRTLLISATYTGCSAA